MLPVCCIRCAHALLSQSIPEAEPMQIPRGFRWYVPPYTPPEVKIVRKTVFVLVSGTVDGRISLWDWDPVNRAVSPLSMPLSVSVPLHAH